jgi:alcohol dehydrogenase-like protein
MTVRRYSRGRAATDAIVEITEATICGTDLHLLKRDVPTCHPGCIRGHEGVGMVRGAARADKRAGLVEAMTLTTTATKRSGPRSAGSRHPVENFAAAAANNFLSHRANYLTAPDGASKRSHQVHGGDEVAFPLSISRISEAHPDTLGMTNTNPGTVVAFNVCRERRIDHGQWQVE